MNIDVEKLRIELKTKVDEVIDNYIQNDNSIIDIPEERIYMEFLVNNQNYIAFTENSNETEEIEMMFAKVEFIDGKKILRDICTSEEYENVVNEFKKRLEMVPID